MADVTFKKRLILIIFSLFFSLNSFSQKKIKEFSTDYLTYTSEIDEFMSANNKSKVVVKTFLKNNNFSEIEKNKIIQISNMMLSKRLKSYPHFNKFFSALISINSSQKRDVLLLQWLNIVEQTINEATISKLLRLFSFTTDLVSNNTLRSSKSAAWMVSNLDFRFEFEFIEPVVIFDTPFNLSCSTDNGSYTIFGTTGKYYSISNKWKGNGGQLNWEIHAKSKDSVYAEINSYMIDCRKSQLIADSSIFYNKSLFSQPILGQVVNKLSKGKEAERYPKFISYSKNVELKEILPNIDYRGGYKLQGSEFVADGGKYADAKIVFKKAGKDIFIANARRFSIGDDRIVAQAAGVKIFFDNDSIFHANLQFTYIDSERKLRLYRKVNGLSGAPMLNTYHNLTMDFELLEWKIDSDIITFGSLPTSAQSSVEFESVDRYLQSKYESIQGIDAIHPLFLVRSYVTTNQEEEFYVKDFARFAQFPLVQIQHYLIRLANDGFIFYDFGRQKITVLPKLYNYIESASGLGDYDVISFRSIIKSGEYDTESDHLVNAELNLATKDLSLLGINSIQVSQNRGVYFFPKDGRIVIKKNRDFIFDGQVFAGDGRLNLFGKDFLFHYDDFKVDLNYIDSMQLSVPVHPLRKDIYDRDILTPIKTIIEAVTGDLRIDHPTNKSGIRIDSFPEFPIFSSYNPSYAYYDRKSIHDGVYKRSSCFFHLQPFEIDSINNYTAKGLWFAGVFESSGIFPAFNDTLRIQKDYSLGFNRKTPEKGFEIYGGKGKYYNNISLSHDGIKGNGDFEYLTSKASASDIFFFPDSTNLYTQLFVISEVLDGVEFPDVNNTKTYAHFEPYNDRLYINKISDNFNLYHTEVSLDGDLLMRPTGVTGTGIMSFEKASLTSNLFTYNANWFNSENSNLNVLTDSSDLAIEAVNLKSHVDLALREGKFNSNGANSYVKFPENQYLAYINKLTWNMENETFVLGNETASVGDLTRFVSTDPRQDSLSFNARTAFYSLKNFIINTTGVDEIYVADAIIFPDSGIVKVDRNNMIETLNKAKILADNLTEYHTFTNATVDIKSAHNYIAKGNYTYYDYMKSEQNIFFKKIIVDKDTITNAIGDIASDQVFHIDNRFDFKGSINLIADRRSLIFDGFFKINHKCDYFDKEWVKFKSSVNPEDPIIRLDSILVNDNNERLFSSIMMRQDTFNIYSTFFTKKKSIMDIEMINIDRYLSYNKRKLAFVINGKDSLDNIFTMYENTCETKGEGEVNLTLDLGDVTVKSIGMINNDVKENKTSFSGFLFIDFFFSEKALFTMAKDIRGEEKMGLNKIEYNDLYYLNTNRLFKDRTRAVKFFDDLEDDKIKRMPNEFSSSLAFTDIKLHWDSKNKVFVNKDLFGLGNILEYPTNDIVDGYVVLEKKYSNSGDGMSILVISDFTLNQFWFKYQSNAMWTFSPDNLDYQDAVGEGKIRLEDSRYNYSYKTKSIFDSEVGKLDRKY